MIMIHGSLLFCHAFNEGASYNINTRDNQEFDFLKNAIRDNPDLQSAKQIFKRGI